MRCPPAVEVFPWKLPLSGENVSGQPPPCPTARLGPGGVFSGPPPCPICGRPWVSISSCSCSCYLKRVLWFGGGIAFHPLPPRGVATHRHHPFQFTPPCWFLPGTSQQQPTNLLRANSSRTSYHHFNNFEMLQSGLLNQTILHPLPPRLFSICHHSAGRITVSWRHSIICIQPPPSCHSFF